MSTPPLLGQYAGHFERLCDLPPAEREAALAALPLPPEARTMLRRLLEADAADGDPLLERIGQGAALLGAGASERFGPWRIVRELGAGGMGTVFLAERMEGGFSQRAAVKLLRGFPTRAGLARLRRERQILAGLDHPNIARLIDGGETAAGQPWLAMEYVEGTDLLTHAGRHARGERLQLFAAVLDAVGHAHRNLVIHRDIKPANVLVAGDGQVKLVDFGIARLVEPDTGGADAGSTRVYSAGYASPEQREGRAVTTQSDIYSLGVLLEAMLSAGPVPLPLDGELKAIIGRASAADVVARYASTGELADELERYRRGLPVRAARSTRRYRLRKFIGRHRLGIGLALAAFTALGLLVWRLDHERGRALEAERAASRDAARAQAALAFLTDAFEAAAPDNALTPTVSVRDLLDHARARLAAEPLDPAVARPLQRLLGGLYAELGDPATGAGLLALGTADAEVSDRSEALALARDHDRHALLAARIGERDAARAAAARGAALRERHAPGDADEGARTLLARALVHHHGGENPEAIALLREALAFGPPDAPLDAALELEITDTLASMLVFSGECRQALELGEARLAPDAVAAAPSTRIQLLRTLGTAHVNCGEVERAVSLYRRAIAAQQALVGHGGARMSGLLNDLGVALAMQGRYREAAEVLAQAGALDLAAGARPSDYATVLGNRAAVFESAGDYSQALALFDAAVADMDRAGTPADAESRRRLLRTRARALVFSGQPQEAAEILAGLRARARRLDGADSLEYLMCTWQLALAERHAGNPESAEAHLREAEAGFAGMLPPTHVIFAHAQRQYGALALSRGDADTAARRFGAALGHMQAGDAAAVDIAVARSELAAARLALGDAGTARSQLDEALPVLRDLLLPTEASRVEAERTARALGLK